MEIKVLSKRCESFDESNVGPCGFCSINGIIAEIVVDDNGKTVYLEAEWVGMADDSICFNATYESIFDYQTLKVDDDENFERIMGEEIEQIMNTADAKKSRYATYYEEMTEMVLKVLSDEYKYDEEDIEELKKSFEACYVDF